MNYKKNCPIILNFNSKQIFVYGIEKKLDAKAFNTLEYLCKHHAKVVRFTELIDNIWSGRPTNNDVLVAAIGRIRKAIDTNKSNSIIRTVHRIGYQIELRAKIQIVTPADNNKNTKTTLTVIKNHLSQMNSKILNPIFRSFKFKALLSILIISFIILHSNSNLENHQGTIKIMLLFPALYTENDTLKSDSYAITRKVSKSISIDSELKTTTPDLLFSKEFENFIYQYNLPQSLYSSIFNKYAVDYITTMRLINKPDGTSVSLHLINKDSFHCKHHFFVHKSDKLIPKISKDLSTYIHDDCNWKTFSDTFPNKQGTNKTISI